MRQQQMFIKDAIRTIESQDKTIEKLAQELKEEKEFSADLKESLYGQYELFDEVVDDLIEERDNLRQQKGVMATNNYYKIVEGYTQNEDIVCEGIKEVEEFFPDIKPSELLKIIKYNDRITVKGFSFKQYEIVVMTEQEIYVYFAKEMLASSETLTKSIEALSAAIK